jgi:hypothetical protein
MDKTVRIIILLLVVFTLASLCIYKLRLDPALHSSNQEQGRRGIQAEVRTAEGQVITVDDDARTLTLDEGSEAVTFIIDERTAIVESGRAVDPSSISSGAAATVKYTQRGGKNVARKIELIPAQPSE